MALYMKNKMQRESTRGKSGKSWEKARWAKIKKKNQSLQIWKIFHRSFLFHTIDRKLKKIYFSYFSFFFFLYNSSTIIHRTWLDIARQGATQTNNDFHPHLVRSPDHAPVSNSTVHPSPFAVSSRNRHDILPRSKFSLVCTICPTINFT